MGAWKEKLVFGALLLALLTPISILQNAIDDDKVGVAFLRWIDNQEAYSRRAVQRFVISTDQRSEEEIALFNQVEAKGISLSPDFEELAVIDKWQITRDPGFEPFREQFLDLVLQSKITLSEGEIEWSNPDVSANVGALVLGFRKLVADMMWLRVDEYWHSGLASRMLPMMETVVALDPHFIEAYALGAWHLAYNITLTVFSAEEKMQYMDQAIGLLEKGIKNNPRSAKLFSELGFTIYFIKLKDWEKSSYYIGEAIKHEHEPWMERLYALTLEKIGEEEEALAFIEDYDRRHPDFIAQRNTLQRLRTKRKARELEKEGRLQEAYSIWRFLEEDDPSDVIAPVEARRLEDILETQVP
jgi:tetratricopeptide (TPR) repeat protein